LALNGVEIEVFDLQGIPVYNQDLEGVLPKEVVDFKAKIRGVDALLIATPEYNYSVPGVLKNALDWGSRPSGDNSFEGKPVAVMGASPGMLGTARAQYHLRKVFVSLNMVPVNRPEVFVTFAGEKIGGDGRLKDEKTRDKIRELVGNLVSLARRLKN